MRWRQAVVDTGATISQMGEDFCVQHGLTYTKETHKLIYLNDTESTTIGSITLKVSFNTNSSFLNISTHQDFPRY